MNANVQNVGFRSIDSIRNAAEFTEPPPEVEKSIVEQRVEAICKDKRASEALAKAVGWKSTSMLNKFAGKRTGIPIDKVAALLLGLGLVTFTHDYAEYLAKGNVIGSNCKCARKNQGECGPRG